MTSKTSSEYQLPCPRLFSAEPFSNPASTVGILRLAHSLHGHLGLGFWTRTPHLASVPLRRTMSSCICMNQTVLLLTTRYTECRFIQWLISKQQSSCASVLVQFKLCGLTEFSLCFYRFPSQTNSKWECNWTKTEICYWDMNGLQFWNQPTYLESWES